jgi:hypothetical protein
MSEFEREQRYIVLKVKDIEAAHFDGKTMAVLNYICQVVAHTREQAGKSPLTCVVVEHDWPEYEPTWRAIEARVSADQFPEAGKMVPPSSDLISKAAELFIQSREPAAMKHAEWALKQLMPHLAPPPMTSETISRLSVNASFESDAYARRVIAERDQQWLEFVGRAAASDQPTSPSRWYFLDRHGVATLCANEADARASATDADRLYPRNAPHRACQLVALSASKPQAASPEDMAVYDSIAAGYPAQPQGAVSDGTRSPHEGEPMCPEKAAYFMRRFRHEEKLLGPNEQAALDFVLAMLAAQPQGAGEAVPDGVWEALQRLIESGDVLGPASREDSILVAAYRDRVRFMAAKGVTTPPASQQAAQAVPSHLPEAITIACGLLAQSADELEAGHKRPTTGKVPEPEVAELIELHRKTVKQLGDGLRAMKGGQQ